MIVVRCICGRPARKVNGTWVGCANLNAKGSRVYYVLDSDLARAA